MSKLPEKLPQLFRSIECRATVVRAAEGEEAAANAPVEIAISSETPVSRWFGNEILDHGKASIDMTFAERGLAFLVGHDQGEYSRLQIGIVKNLAVGKDRVLRGEVTFSSDAEAQRIRQDMLDGIRPYISVGYRLIEYVLEKSDDSGDTYRATKWMPGEVSTVTVPADASVGVGRKDGGEEQPVRERAAAGDAAQQEKRTMKPEVTTETPAAPDPAIAAEAQRKAVADALEARNKEVAEITQLCVSHGMSERASEFIASGKSPGEIALAILEAKRSAPIAQPPSERGSAAIITDKSKKPEYSVVRAYSGCLNMRHGGGPGLDGYEAECHQEIDGSLPKSYARHGGIFMPQQQSASPGLIRAIRRQYPILMQRAGLDSATATSGAELVFDEAGDMIDLLRNMSVCTRLGARVLSNLHSPITFPRQTAAATMAWVGENPGSDASESDLDTGTIAMAPKTAITTSSFSRQLLAQASWDVEALLRLDQALVLALGLDKAGIHGTGSSNQPTGIYAASGVNSKAMGGAVTFGELVDMATEVAIDNAMLGSTGYATTPGMAGKLMQTLEFSAAGANRIWTGTHAEGVINGSRAVSSNQVSATMTGSTETGGSEYGIIYGVWSEMLIGTWGAQEVIVDPYAKKKQTMIEVTSWQLVDILLRYAQAFCKATGATLA